MYVKITNKQADSNTVYEAEGMKLYESEQDGYMDLEVQVVDGSFIVILPRDGSHEVYLMNEYGRTIDRYQLKP